ncbi:MAG: pyroglutamyl-peptidase I [Myxococcota bacterium]
MPSVLITGYGPFANTPVNPAEQVARTLDGSRIGEADVVSKIVNNSFFEAIDEVTTAIEQTSPVLVVMMGEYGGRSMITVERIAINYNDSTRYGLTDNKGRSLQGEPTVPGGPAGIYATAPIRAMVQAMRQAGVPADISDTPGTFGCNHLMYGVLYYLQDRGLAIPAAWVHLPALPSIAARDENVGMPSMSVETATKGVSAAIEAALRNPNDIDTPLASRFQI